jgi:lycopene cyclase domain-containing protein
MHEYTIAAVVAAVVVVAVELVWLRTGIFTKVSYWLSMAIVFFFQALVDGWLTKRSAPVVIYGRRQFLGVRFPFSIPVEDFVYGFALVTLTIVLWERAGRMASS